MCAVAVRRTTNFLVAAAGRSRVCTIGDAKTPAACVGLLLILVLAVGTLSRTRWSRGGDEWDGRGELGRAKGFLTLWTVSAYFAAPEPS